MKSVNPYLKFPGNSEEAFDFYHGVFGGDFAAVVRYRDLDMTAEMGELSEEDLDRIGHIALPLGNGAMLMATDELDGRERPLEMGINFYITLEPESAEEAERLFEALSDGGRVEMPLQRTAWAEKFGSLADRFGVRWMVSYPGDVEFDPPSEA